MKYEELIFITEETISPMSDYEIECVRQGINDKINLLMMADDRCKKVLYARKKPTKALETQLDTLMQTNPGLANALIDLLNSVKS